MIKKLMFYVKQTIDFFYLRCNGVTTSFGNVRLYGFPIIIMSKGSKIIIEKGVTLVSKTKFNPSGINHPVILATLRPGAVLLIKKNSGLSGCTINCAKKIVIGEYVGIGSNVTIYDTDFHAIEPCYRRYDNINKTKIEEVIIEDYAWIGANSIVLKGVVVGYSSVLGAGSIATKNIEPFSVYAGNPAKFIKKIDNYSLLLKKQ